MGDGIGEREREMRGGREMRFDEMAEREKEGEGEITRGWR